MQYRYSAKIVDDYFHKNIDIYNRNRYNVCVYLSLKFGALFAQNFPREAWKPKSTLVSISNGGAHNDSKKGVPTET